MSLLIENNLLSEYPAFSFLRWMKKLNIVSVPVQNLILTLLFTIFLFLASTLDNSLILKKPNIGFLQHPAIWMFLLIQIIVPFFINTSIKRFFNMPNWKHCIISPKFFNDKFNDEIKNLKANILMKNVKSQLIFTFFIIIGVVAFIWNTFQNQNPLKFLGFEFWDSYDYPYGYWITRVYKFYIWCLYFPSILHLYLFIIIRTLKLIKLAYNHQMLILEPYHYDGNGGISQFIKNIINPMVPVMLITCLLSIFVLIIHQKLDFTSISSLFIASLFFLIFYFIPALYLRNIIKKDKERQLTEIADRQQKLLIIISDNNDSHSIKDNYEIIDSLNSIANKIKSIPNWPNHIFILKIFTISYFPAIFNFILKFIIQYFI